MGDTSAKVQKVVEKQMEFGEKILAAVKASPEGGTKPIAKRAALCGELAGAVGAATAAVADHGSQDLPAGGKPPYVGLIDQRILVLSTTTMTAAPKEAVGVITLDRVVGVSAGETKLMGMTMGTFALAMRDADPFSFEVPKTARKDGDAFVSALRQQLARRPGA